MSLEAKYALNLGYPIFIDGIRFTSNEFLRSNPRWWWSKKKKTAFLAADKRVDSLEIVMVWGDYEKFDYYQRTYKVRDFLNTGKQEDFPKKVNNAVRYALTNKLLNRIIQGG